MLKEMLLINKMHTPQDKMYAGYYVVYMQVNELGYGSTINQTKISLKDSVTNLKA
jgi:hypothetical protein